MKKLVLILGNGLTMDLLSNMDEKKDDIDLSNLFSNAKSDPVVVSAKVNEFFDCLRTADKLSDDVKEYRESMQASTRSKSQRVRRIRALSHYCGIQ